MCDCGFPNALWHFLDAETPCEPRPRAVPEVGPPQFVDCGPLPGPLVVSVDRVELPDGAGLVFWGFDPAGGMELGWSRGFDYESLGEGHYEDDQL